MKVLINFRHGLGDAVQLTTVLEHLRKHRSEWTVHVATLIGKHSAFHGLCDRVFIDGRESVPCCQYQTKYHLDWHECHVSYPDSPSTKAERSLREDFGIAPDPELCRYSIQRGPDALSRAGRYLERVCGKRKGSGGRYPAVLIHYEGNTSAEFKNIPTDIIRRVCGDILESGLTPIILDWDFRTPLAQPAADGCPSRIHCADVHQDLWQNTGTGDAETLAALIELSSLMIGVDSGPLHVAAATTTPTLGVWTRHHPLHYFGHAPNLTHLVPINHADFIRGSRAIGEDYFNRHYQYQTYRHLEDALRVAVRRQLSPPADEPGLIFSRDFWIRGENGEQDLVVVHDIAEQDSYRIGEIEPSTPEPVVVDVGAHIGCFSKRFHQKHPAARIVAVECCPENVAVLRKNVGDFATVIQAAVTYEPEVALLNAVYANCRSTGGSAVIDRTELQRRVESNELKTDPAATGIAEYWADFRTIHTLTLEDLMEQHGFDAIDVLKLDCEGSEFSILGNSPSLDRIGLIIGEYHGKTNFEQLVAERFQGWELKTLSDGELGNFWLVNPRLVITKAGADQTVATSNGESEYESIETATRNGDGSYTVFKYPAEVGGLKAPNDHAAKEFSFDRAAGNEPAEHAVQPQTAASAISSVGEFHQRLSDALHPSDVSEQATLIPYYEALFKVATQWRCERIVEIGVRSGYSALTWLLANPGATLIGVEADEDERSVNTHTGRKGLWRHAQTILRSLPFHLVLVDSHSLRRLPDADLIYVDGDHTFKGCLADLRLAEQSTNRIVVDDYDSIPGVRQACDTFTSEYPAFERRHIENGLTGLIVFERSVSR